MYKIKYNWKRKQIFTISRLSISSKLSVKNSIIFFFLYRQKNAHLLSWNLNTNHFPCQVTYILSPVFLPSQFNQPMAQIFAMHTTKLAKLMARFSGLDIIDLPKNGITICSTNIYLTRTMSTQACLFHSSSTSFLILIRDNT